MKQYRDLHAALPLLKCLGSDIRIDILDLLQRKGPMRMTDIASALGITNGSLSPHIKQMSECGLINISFSSGKHGLQRTCSVREQQILLEIEGLGRNANLYETEIGVGQYVAYQAFPTCGISTPDHLIGKEDDPRYFSSPERVDAGIIWMGHGYVEYMIPNYLKPQQELIELLISMEIASEAPGFREDWPSDIYFSINGVRLCDWQLPGDFGKNPGIYTPSWWDRNWNQYGQLKFLSIDRDGTYMDGFRRSDVSLDDLRITADSSILFRITAPETAEHCGGLTLYGRSFGNYDQALRIRVHYKDRQEP
ncbi:MAG: ArsR family transcriptional regulator [Oscillospiraceae bacterium]|nr:ArsR family transcriptional regulator [Oscillospiraceae bacterium]